MHRFALVGIALIAATSVSPLGAQELLSPPRETTTSAQQPSSAPDIVALTTEKQSDGLPSSTSLHSIVTWLSTNFDLAPTEVLPRIKRASSSVIASLRSRDLLGAAGQPSADSEGGRTTVALYDTSQNTIYLPMDWAGNSPIDLSVLIHEMVHHLQHIAKTRFECPQAREQLAYAAQQKWLGLFGRNLEDEFQIDPFTLLVTTRCML